MHEVGICQSIITTIESELTEDQLEAIQEIHLKVGILSGVEPMFLKHVWQFMVVDGPFQDASLHIETVGVLAACEHCAQTFKVEQYRFVCPECGNPASKVVEGKELHIHKIIFTETVELAHEKTSQ